MSRIRGLAACIVISTLSSGFALPTLAQVVAPVAPASHQLDGEDRARMIAALEGAPDHGLTAPSAAGLSDAALEDAIIVYAQAMRGQRLAGRFPNNWALRPQPYDAVGAFGRAVAADRLRGWLDDLPPSHEEYRELVRALVRYRAIEAGGGWSRIDDGPTLKPGDRDSRIAMLRRRIEVETDIRIDNGDETLFDPALAEVLREEQARLGAPVSGVLDEVTTAAFNIPVARRVATLEANLERERWLPRVAPRRRITVNVAGPDLAVAEGRREVLAMRVIVGRPSDPTPLFIDRIDAVVLNPPWDVPAEIARKEILPKAAADPGYLERNDYVLLPDGRLQQKPGPQSALGVVKFDLTNPFAVDLHDTPCRDLFAGAARALSHGCIRVEKPLELARLVLAFDPAWNAEAIDAVISSGRTLRIPVADSPDVWVVYRTAFVEDGKVNFRADVYRWDDKLMRLLGVAD